MIAEYPVYECLEKDLLKSLKKKHARISEGIPRDVLSTIFNGIQEGILGTISEKVTGRVSFTWAISKEKFLQEFTKK